MLTMVHEGKGPVAYSGAGCLQWVHVGRDPSAFSRSVGVRVQQLTVGTCGQGV